MTTTSSNKAQSGSQLSREGVFDRAAQTLLGNLSGDEDMILNYSGESVDYIRFNQAKLRQATHVEDGLLTIQYMSGSRQLTAEIQLTHDADEPARLLDLLKTLRRNVAGLPEDPFVVRPEPGTSSREVHAGTLCAPSTFVKDVLLPNKDLDVVGIHQAGTSFRGVAHSKGLRHWFETTGFATDYSIFHPGGKAVKGTFAGTQWDGPGVTNKLSRQASLLSRLDREPLRLKPGRYDVYLEPAAVADLIAMFSYEGVSESCIRQGASALIGLVNGKHKLSPKFSLDEDFSEGLVPRFNDFGELAPQRLAIVDQGAFVNSLVSPRTAREYRLPSNGAVSGEWLRAPRVATGQLDSAKAIEKLGTGIYLPNLHYLNWSDRQGARVTGMTRYACMWVEGGELVAPIVDMRFDESLFACLGDNLESCTTSAELVPNTGSYGGRELGGITAPGMLIRNFSFTL